jgi:hypothetical protein
VCGKGEGCAKDVSSYTSHTIYPFFGEGVPEPRRYDSTAVNGNGLHANLAFVHGMQSLFGEAGSGMKPRTGFLSQQLKTRIADVAKTAVPYLP